jgi:DNA-binding TFAR19-related protein (PDSD5 family)
MTLREARRTAILAQVKMVGPVALDTFGMKRIRFNTGSTTSQIETALEELARTGEVRVRVVGGQIVVSAVGGRE